MNEYVLLYRNTTESRHETMGTPEQAQQTMQKWRAWFKHMTSWKSISSGARRVGSS